jgi:hypothetical protein
MIRSHLSLHVDTLQKTYSPYTPKPLEHYHFPPNVTRFPIRSVPKSSWEPPFVPVMPLSLLLQVGSLPGKATLLVWCGLWREAACQGETEIDISARFLRRYALHKRTTHRSLQVLERAGLLTIYRDGHHMLRVSVRTGQKTREEAPDDAGW